MASTSTETNSIVKLKKGDTNYKEGVETYQCTRTITRVDTFVSYKTVEQLDAALAIAAQKKADDLAAAAANYDTQLADLAAQKAALLAAS